MAIAFKFKSRRSASITKRDSEALNSQDRLRLRIISTKIDTILRTTIGNHQNARRVIVNELVREYIDALRIVVIKIPDHRPERIHYLPMTFASMEDHLLRIGVTVSE